MSDFPISDRLARQLWDALGGDAALIEKVTFSGEGRLESPFALTDLAAASFAVAGTAVSELLAEVGEPVEGFDVDRVIASSFMYLPVGPSIPLGVEPKPIPPRAALPFWTELPTKDGKYIFIHGANETHKKRLMAALDVPEDINAVAAAVAQWNADELETYLIERDCIVAVGKTPEEWLAHPAGAAIDAEPVAWITDFPVSEGAGSGWRPTVGRPLAGIKVLDMTRVYAGPLATRFLAGLGAEVLRIEPPNSDEARALGNVAAFSASRYPEQNLGKRWAFLDLKTAEGLERFKELLAEADVFVNGYRPGGINGIISEEERRAINPDLVEVCHTAFGWQGPWRTRRGFDSSVQFSVGFALATQRWALEDPENRLPLHVNGNPFDGSHPTHTAVEILDVSTGYQIATAAIRGLTKRLSTGAGSISKLSLARTASLMLHEGESDPAPAIELPMNGPYEDSGTVYSAPYGPSRRLRWPMEIPGAPIFFERPLEPAGASNPVWAS